MRSLEDLLFNNDNEVDEINEYRRQLEHMMEEKNLKSDEEVVKLSQELDKLIVNYYRNNE